MFKRATKIGRGLQDLKIFLSTERQISSLTLIRDSTSFLPTRKQRNLVWSTGVSLYYINLMRLDIGQVYSMSAGDVYKYRDNNERRNGKLLSYQKVKGLNVCNTALTFQEQQARLKEYLYTPVELINSQEQLENVMRNCNKQDYLILYSPDDKFLSKKKYDFQINYVENRFQKGQWLSEKSVSTDLQILFSSNYELIKNNVGD